jgi:hypothetical protein
MMMMMTPPPCTTPAPELIFDPPVTGSRWFGGDDRTGFGPRNVASGQTIRLPRATRMTAFGLRFTGPFRTDMAGHRKTPTLLLHLRDAKGVILDAAVTRVPLSFESGWIFWELEAELLADTDYHFTAYSVTAYSDQSNSGVAFTPIVDHGVTLGAASNATRPELESWESWQTGVDSLHWQIRDAACPL